MHMEKVLKIQQQYEPGSKRILEINPNHSLIQTLSNYANDDSHTDTLKDSAQMLLDQALIIQGETIADPTAFARRMAHFMEKGLAA